jgi:hypothetical protein
LFTGSFANQVYFFTTNFQFWCDPGILIDIHNYNHTIRFGKKSRTYLLTASNFGIVCKGKDTTLPDDLIKLLRAYKDLPVHKIPSIHHGQK